MAQNADNQDDESSTIDESAKVTEEDLRRDFEEAEVEQDSKTSSDESDDDKQDEEQSDETGKDGGKTDDQDQDEDSEDDNQEDSNDDDSVFIKEFPNIKGDTLEDYTKNLEATIRQSSNEGKRLADENADLKGRLAKGSDDSSTTGRDDNADSDVDVTNPLSLWAKQNMDKEINEAYTDFSKDFPQVSDAGEYQKFTNTVAELSATILNSQKRLASPRELYSKAAAILGWEPSTTVSSKDKLQVALKNRAAIPKTSSATKKAPKSRVTDAVIAINRKMYPTKSDEEIRKELEEYVQ